ncbi:MAG: polysaccharide biosynthesis protein [Zoogloea sp.]|nr:polysaccharide biosynthesis protein [Zoogloea sp.]
MEKLFHYLKADHAVLARRVRQCLAIAVDSCFLLLSLWSAFALRLGEWYVPTPQIAALFLLAPLVGVPIFIRFGLYRAIIRYAGFRALVAVSQAVAVYGVAWALLALLSRVPGVPRSAIFINVLMALLLIGGSRMVGRWWLTGASLWGERLGLAGREQARMKVVIYGAGSAGAKLAGALAHSTEFQPVAMVDDDPALHGKVLNGLEIHPPEHLSRLIRNERISEVLLAIPSVSRVQRSEVLARLEGFPVRVRTLPGIVEIAQGRVKVEDLRELDIVDLLGRDPVPPNEDLLRADICGKVVMVTGAGGSIGAELCRQIVLLRPRLLVLFEQGEFALYALEKELIELLHNAGGDGDEDEPAGEVRLVAMLGSVADGDRVRTVCSAFGVHTIYHAAAYKHVPMVEHNMTEGLRNNVFGTLRCAQAAMECGVGTFVLVSTDKAVRPSSVMGASKRLAEMVLQALSALPEAAGTRFTMVRFGNVLGSSGSVVPLFREQIRNGGPITVTHPDIIRYFMTIPEAAQLVIQAGAMGQGGDVFVLHMGEPVRIAELARRMIHLSGLQVRDHHNPAGDIEILFTGLRPGEKLYEELLIGDNVSSTEHPRILRAQEERLPWARLGQILDQMEEAIGRLEFERLRELLLEAVSGYTPQCGVVDNLHGLVAPHGRKPVMRSISA